MPKPRVIPPLNLQAELGKSVDIDEEPLRFGKHQGETPCKVAQEDPDYIIWLWETVKDKTVCSHALYELCKLTQESSDEEVASYLDGHLKFK